MTRVSLHAIAPALALLFLAACGGRTRGESDDAGATTEGGGSSDAGGTSTDAHAPGTDAGTGKTCIDIDAAAFATTCAVDTDCINVATGQLCDGYNCICGGTAISASAEASYQAIFSTVTPGTGPFCSCPYFGAPRCIEQTCIYCPAPSLGGPIPAGCPDAG